MHIIIYNNEKLNMNKVQIIKRISFNILLIFSLIEFILILFSVILMGSTQISGGISIEDIKGSYSTQYTIRDIDTKNESITIHMQLHKPYDDKVSLISSSTRIVDGFNTYNLHNAEGIELDNAIDFANSNTTDCILEFKTTGKHLNHNNDTMKLVCVPDIFATNNYYDKTIFIGEYTSNKLLLIRFIILILCIITCVLLWRNLKTLQYKDERIFYNIINTMEKVLISKGTYQFIYQIILSDNIDNNIIKRVNADIRSTTDYLFTFLNRVSKQKPMADNDLYLLTLLLLRIPNKAIRKLLNVSDKTIYNRTSQLRSLYKSDKYIQF